MLLMADKKRIRKGAQLNVWIKHSIRNALDKACDTNDRSVRAEVERALTMYLTSHGFLQEQKPKAPH